MARKSILFFFVQSLLAQVIFGQCIGNSINNGNSVLPGSGYGGYGSAGFGNYGLNLGNNVGCQSNSAGIGFANGLGFNNAGLNYGNGLAANSNGGGLTVTSSSPIAPTGITVASENAIEGPVAVTAEMPFLSAVTVEGQVQSDGQAATSYSCGDGHFGVVENTASNQNGENGIVVGPASNIGSSLGNGLVSSNIGSGFGNALGSLNAGLGARGVGASGLGFGNQGCGFGASGLGFGARQGFGPGFGFGAGLRQGALGNRVC